jgi:hypothetical protein
MSDALWWFSSWLVVEPSGITFLILWLTVPIVVTLLTRNFRWLWITVAGLITAFWWIVPLMYESWMITHYYSG